MATGTFNGLHGSGENGQWGYFGGSGYDPNQWGYIDYENYHPKVRGKFSIPAPSTYYKINTVKLTFSIRRNGGYNVRGYLYDAQPTTTKTIPSGSISTEQHWPSSGTQTDNYTWDSRALTWNIASKNYTAAKTLYVWFMTNSNISGAYAEIGDGYSGSSRVAVETTETGYSTNWTVQSANTSQGTVTGGGTFTSGTISINATPATGYHFVQWTFTRLPSTSAGSSTTAAWSNGASNYFGYAYKAVASFAINVYTISFNANGGTLGTPTSQTKNHGATLTLRAACTHANGSNQNSYTVAYAANGGSSTPSTQTSTKYTKYTFAGWNTNSSGTGTNYSAGGSYTGNANATLYAKWTTSTVQNSVTLSGAISHANTTDTRTVTFNANGGSVSPASRNSTATRSYTFEKWHLNSVSGTAYAAGASYTPSANCTMYAKWNESVGTFSAVSLPTPTRTGYTFAGWYTSASGGTKRGDGGGSYTPSASETIYAHWTNNSYTIAYSLGGGSLPSGQNAGTHSTYTTEALNPTSAKWDTGIGNGATSVWTYIEHPTKTGYTFNGWTVTGMDSNTHHYWYSSANQTSTATSWANTTNAGNAYEFYNLRATSGTVTFTANWTANTYTVTLNQNGGAGGTTSVTATYNSAMPSATMPTRIGYTFAGYYDATSGGTQYYTSAGASARNWNKTSATTLYARWTVKTTTFKLDPNKGTLAAQAGGSENATTKDYTYNYGTTQTLPSPVRTGYTFRCWARNMSGSEVINYGRAFMWTDYFQAAFFVYQADWSAITTYAPGIASAACSIASCTESGGWSMGIATSSYKPFVQFYDPGASAYKTAYATDAITTWSAGWHLINVLYKDKIMYLYKDGTIIATTATGTNAISYHSVNSLFQAGEPNGTQNGIGNSNAYYKGKISPIYINHQNTAHTGLIAGASAYNGSYTWTAQYYATANQLIKLNPNGGTVVPQAGGAASSSTENYYYTYGTNQTLPTPTRTGYTFITWGRQMNGTSEAINYGRAHMHTTALRMRIRAYLDNWSTLGTKTIVSCTESGGWSLGNSDGKICFWCYSQEDAAYKNALSTTTWASLAAGWHCFELTFDGTNAKGYVDGILIATSAAFTTVSGKTTGAIGYNAQNDIFVGDEATGTRAGHSGSNYFNGMVGPLYMSESATPVGTGSINAMSMFASTSGWTFAAQWQPHTYTVTFKTGNTTMGTQSFTYGTAQNLTAVTNLSNAPVSGNGWSFYGWATDVNTNTRTYTDGQSVNNLTATDEGNVTLYAIYSRSITGKYYNSATATTTTNISGVTQYYKNTSTTAAAASSVTFPTLYTYTGQSNSWAPKAWSNGTGTAQTIAAATSGTAASGTPSATSSATYNALYSRTAVISYNANGGTGTTSNTTGTQWYNAGNTAATALSLTLATNAFTRTGYTFSKWALNSASGTQYNAGANYTVTNTGWDSSRTAATMYAIWLENSYTVQFKTGNTQMGTQNFTYTESKALTTESSMNANRPVSTTYGWSFEGWSTSVNTTTKTYSDGQTVSGLSATNGATVTLYAIYKRNITFKYYNSASATSVTTDTSNIQYYRNSSTTAAGGTAVTVPALYTNTTYGWTPYGWIRNANTYAAASGFPTDGSSTSVTPSITLSPLLYALYTRTVTLNYNANGGSSTTTATTGAQRRNANNTNAETITLTTATSTFTPPVGYAFDKWNTASDASGTDYAEGASYSWGNVSWTSSKSKTLYAIYKPYALIHFYQDSSNQWKPAFVYVWNSTDSEWQLTMPEGYDNGSWKIGGPQ